jgi:WD40 repeat protein
MLCRERKELEERWNRRRFSPKVDILRPARSAVYCSFALENYVITGARNRSICFYEFEQKERALSVIFRIKDAHAGSVLCMEVDPLGGGGAGTMYTGGSDGRVNVWDLDGFLTEWNTFRGAPGLVKSMAGHEAGVLDLVVDADRLLSW